MELGFPFDIDGTGRTRGSRDHIRDMVEQVLFTSPGERVQRPDFGAGVDQLIFAAAGRDLAATTTSVIQAALQRWLGELIRVEQVRVEEADGILEVTVRYFVEQSNELRSDTFTAGGPSK